MQGPRLTEERLRYHLDSNQVMRERLCLALLPLLGHFSHGRPRRPKGGPDGARDIECLYQGIVPTWGAVGFRNGGGNDSESRTSAKKKFRDDLDGARSENPALASFIFFTNVDLTPGDKDDLIAYAAGNGVKTVHVFDMEILRNVLDSRDGLLPREQYLEIPINGEVGVSKAIQSSKIASCSFPLKFAQKSGTDECDPKVFEKIKAFLLESLCRCFGHACVVTGCEDFVFLLTLARADRETDLGHVAYDLELHCHITEFVRAFEDRLNYYLAGSSDHPPILKTLSGDQILEQGLTLGRDIPHRIYRAPPSRIVMKGVDGIRFPADKAFTTSALLGLLGKAFGGVKIVLWDEIEKYPDALKVMTMIDWIGDHGFSWDNLRLDPNNPESWEYDCG